MLDTIVPVRTRLNEHGWKPEEVLIHEHQRRRLLLGWLSHVGQLAAGTAQQIIMVPVYLQFWSTETFSAWLIILAAAALTGPADLGLSGVALNRFLRLRHSPAGEQRTNDVLKRLLGSYLWVMGAGGAVLAAIMGVAAATPVSQLPPVAHVPGFLLALAVVVFAMLLQLPSGLASAMLRARDLAALPARIATWGTILGMLAQLLALWLGGGLVAVACMLGLSLLGQAGFMMFCSLRLAFPWVQIGLRFRNWRDVRRDFGTAWPYGAPTMIDIMLAYAPIIVVSVIVSDVQLIALWGVLRTLVGLCRQLDIQLALPLAAEVGRAQAAGRKVEVSRLVFDGTCMISCITAAVCGALLAFGPQIIDVWTKGRITWDGGLATLLVATAFVAAPNLIAQTVAYYTGGGGVLLRARAAHLVLLAVLAIPAVLFAGVHGLAAALLLSEVGVIAIFMWPSIMAPRLNNARYAAFWLTFCAAATLSLTLISGLMIDRVVPLTRFAGLAMKGAIWTALFSFVFVLSIKLELLARLRRLAGG